MGEWQKEQRTLQGSLCSRDFSVGSYHSREWWPWVKFMSSLWKIAAHWNGAAVVQLITRLAIMLYKLEAWILHTMLCLTRRTMTQLTIQRLTPTQLIRDFPAVAISLVLDVKVLVLLVHAVWRALLPFGDTGRRLALVLRVIHFHGLACGCGVREWAGEVRC